MRRLIGTTILLLLASGCGEGGASAPPAPGHDAALGHVKAALDAWKAGKAKDLASGSPPIRFVDPDLSAGARLESYTPGPEPQTTDHVVDCPVELTIVDRKKARRTVRAVYQVVAAPDLAVLRNDP